MNQTLIPPATSLENTRRYDIDYLRVIAIVLVLYFHTAMIFTAEWDYHIKNPETSNIWLEFNFFLSRFRMPLLFFISGAGSFFALRKRTGGTYVKERFTRLIIPLLFGMLVIVPPQIYIERIVQGVEYASFWEFYPSTFEGVPYPEGNFSWHHLWFILYLFFYSLLAAPLFVRLQRTPQGDSSTESWMRNNPLTSVFLLIVPTIFIELSLVFRFPVTHNLIHDGYAFPYFFTFFVVGYVMTRYRFLTDALVKHRKDLLKWAILAIILINYFRWNQLEPSVFVKGAWWEMYFKYTHRVLYPVNAWLWVFAALGYGGAYLNRPSAWLKRANRGIYPFYIIHQTVIILIGYYVIQIQESILAKFILVSTLSLILTILAYEFLVKPYRLMRFFMGVKEK